MTSLGVGFITGAFIIINKNKCCKKKQKTNIITSITRHTFLDIPGYFQITVKNEVGLLQLKADPSLHAAMA